MSFSTKAHFRQIEPALYFEQHLIKGIRPDGRGVSELRPVSLSVSTLSTADASAIVKQGEMTLACGIKIAMAKPLPETPDQGYLVPNVDLSPLCHPKFRPGLPSEVAQSASQFVMDVLTNSQFVNLCDLCILESKYVWLLYIDVVCLNYDGSLLDACIKAVTAALRLVRLPEVSLQDGDIVSVGPVSVALRLNPFLPVCLTLAIGQVNNQMVLLLDPTEEEETGLNGGGSITIALLDDESVCHMLKLGGDGISSLQMKECLSVVRAKGSHVRDMIKKASNA